METRISYTSREIADMIGMARENMQTLIELNARGFDMTQSIETQERRINSLKRMQMTSKIELAAIN
jgi:phage regulator Rha-like protein